MYKLIFCLLIYIPCSGQIKMTVSGCDPIIIKFDSLSANTIYKRAYNWTQVYYKNPKIGLKGQIENEFLRIDAYHKAAIIIGKGILSSNYNLSYNLTIEVKEGKAKFSYIPLCVFTGEIAPTETNYFQYFKKDGSLTKFGIVAIPQAENAANSMLNNLIDFIKNGSPSW